MLPTGPRRSGLAASFDQFDRGPTGLGPARERGDVRREHAPSERLLGREMTRARRPGPTPSRSMPVPNTWKRQVSRASSGSAGPGRLSTIRQASSTAMRRSSISSRLKPNRAARPAVAVRTTPRKPVFPGTVNSTTSPASAAVASNHPRRSRSAPCCFDSRALSALSGSHLSDRLAARWSAATIPGHTGWARRSGVV